MHFVLLNPFGLGVLAGAGGLWLYKKYETETREALSNVVSKSKGLLGLGAKPERATEKAAPEAPRKRPGKSAPELSA